MKEIKKITSVDDLLSKSKKLSPGDWIYRGVADCDYKLLPSIGRTRHSTLKEKEDTGREEEKQALWRFRDKVRPFINLSVENELEWMVIAQHHGLPTRLLDWTKSPLVAAYFAVTEIEDRISVSSNGECSRTPINGAVYAVKTPPKVGPKDYKRPFEINSVKLIDPPYISERIPRQVSVLTIHPEPLKPWEPPDAVMFLISREDKMSIKEELDWLGVNRAALFPGIDAIAGYIGWQLKWNRLK